MTTTTEFNFDIPKNEWWTQNRRGNWRAKYRHTSAVKRRAHLTIRSIMNRTGAHTTQDTVWPIHVTAIIHPLTHGRFDPENAAPMVKAILDAFTVVGYWPDDNGDYIIGPDYRLGRPSSEKGRYGITITLEEHRNENEP